MFTYGDKLHWRIQKTDGIHDRYGEFVKYNGNKSRVCVNFQTERAGTIPVWLPTRAVRKVNE